MKTTTRKNKAISEGKGKRSKKGKEKSALKKDRPFRAVFFLPTSIVPIGGAVP
jgi:hypothetical protein